MFGAWGTALNPQSSDTLLQLRALDWVTDGNIIYIKSSKLKKISKKMFM